MPTILRYRTLCIVLAGLFIVDSRDSVLAEENSKYLLNESDRTWTRDRTSHKSE